MVLFVYYSKYMGRFRPILHFRGYCTPMDVEEQWREILREAVGGATQPILGTHFRFAVNTVAGKKGLRFPPVFPPATEPDLRFIQLIERFPDVVSLMRRPGRDFLVAPSSRSDLLTQDRSFGIRFDLFGAFTVVSNNHPYYDKLNDTVFWRTPDDTSGELFTSHVPIKPATLQSETELRRDFIASLVDQPNVRSILSASLATELRLQTFSKAVRNVGVQREWHSFRTKRVEERIQNWAKDNGIVWKDTWLTEERGERAHRRDAELVTSPAPKPERDTLNVLFSVLDAADIQRISIPLDLVLKALSSARKTR